jgi:hypothetical protein
VVELASFVDAGTVWNTQLATYGRLFKQPLSSTLAIHAA